MEPKEEKHWEINGTENLSDFGFRFPYLNLPTIKASHCGRKRKSWDTLSAKQEEQPRYPSQQLQKHSRIVLIFGFCRQREMKY